MKPIIISHSSALEYWRFIRVKGIKFQRLSYSKSLLKVPCQVNDLEMEGLTLLSRPVHVLVSKSNLRRTHENIFSHCVKTDLPKFSLVYTESGLYICSPEFLFIQMAHYLELIELIQLGFELCGSYIVSQETSYGHAPLTSVEKLSAFIDKAEGLHGAKKARRALKYMVNGSASPMETKLVMLLCLPHFMGGYSIEKPQMNYRIDFDVMARKIGRKRYCKCDLYWPKPKLAIEYDGSEFHEGTEQAYNDSSRRDALVAMDISVITVMKWQIKDGAALNGIARAVAKRLGKQLRYKDPQFTQKHVELHNKLFPKPDRRL